MNSTLNNDIKKILCKEIANAYFSRHSKLAFRQFVQKIPSHVFITLALHGKTVDHVLRCIDVQIPLHFDVFGDIVIPSYLSPDFLDKFLCNESEAPDQTGRNTFVKISNDADNFKFQNNEALYKPCSACQKDDLRECFDCKNRRSFQFHGNVKSLKFDMLVSVNNKYFQLPKMPVYPFADEQNFKHQSHVLNTFNKIVKEIVEEYRLQTASRPWKYSTK